MVLNNKGFAVTGILYTILLMFLILLSGILSMMSTRKVLLDKMKKETQDNLKEVKTIDKSLYSDDSGASIPVLSKGMIPVVWDGVNWVKADIRSKWYDYNAMEWANVVLVTDETRKYYQEQPVDTPIKDDEVLAYLVWIPRYKYKLFNVDAVVKTAQSIEIEFEDKDTPKSDGKMLGDLKQPVEANGAWYTHPAFTLGEQEIDGFWIGKFEITGTTAMPTVKPNISSLRSANISTIFSALQKFNDDVIYGLGEPSDAHMIKNVEWGAVAYLAYSKYGKNATVWLNPSNTGITGCAGLSASPTSSIGCKYDYTTSNGQQASTTGNTYGVYDMSGGAAEYVMGAVFNSDNKTINVSSSGFLQSVIDGATMDKYIDKYIYGTTKNDQDAYNRRILGDATGETRGWQGDYSNFIASTSPWFSRGGNYGSTTGGGIFAFEGTTGFTNASIGSRLTITN